MSGRSVFLVDRSHVTGMPPPLVKLVLGIIREAQRDIVAGRTVRNKNNYDDAVLFFQSDYYQFLLDYVSCWFPDIPHRLPEGVQV